MGEFAYKPYSVGQQEGNIPDHHLSYGGIYGGKKFIFCFYLGFGLGRAAWLWLAALLALPAAAQELPDPGAPVDAARQALEEWVQVRRILSQERRDWQLGRELLEERIALVQREIDGLRTQMAGAQASIAEVDRKRGELLTENERLKASAASLAGTVAVSLFDPVSRGTVRYAGPFGSLMAICSKRLINSPGLS